MLTRKLWEYRCKWFKACGLEVVRELDELGRKGWELVGFTPAKDYGHTEGWTFAVFKRELTGGQ